MNLKRGRVLLAKCIEKHFGKINIGDLDEM